MKTMTRPQAELNLATAPEEVDTEQYRNRNAQQPQQRVTNFSRGVRDFCEVHASEELQRSCRQAFSMTT